jgi:hypothetical protein
MMALDRTAAAIAIASFVGALPWLALSSEAVADALTRPTAVSNSSIDASDRQPTGTLESEDDRRLAQSTQPGPHQATASEETILAQFELSAREGVEEEVARAHGLELVDRSALRSLGVRIARYRLPTVATVLKRLRADRRITLAVINVRYAPHAPLQETEVGAAAPPTGRTLRTSDDERRAAWPEDGDNRQTASRPTPSRDRVASMGTRSPRRVDPAAEAPARDWIEARRTRRICGDILGDPAGYDHALVQHCQSVSDK